jgi:hypothetical protein
MLDSKQLRTMARHCRSMASSRRTDEASRTLLRMAETYDSQANAAERQRMREDA